MRGSVLDLNKMTVVHKCHCLVTIKNLSIQVGRFNKNVIPGRLSIALLTVDNAVETSMVLI